MKQRVDQTYINDTHARHAQILKHATLFFSRDFPNLPTVIPIMDHIDQVLTTASVDKKTFTPAVRAALRTARHTLNRYYQLTDDSDVYRIAMGEKLLISNVVC